MGFNDLPNEQEERIRELERRAEINAELERRVAEVRRELVEIERRRQDDARRRAELEQEELRQVDNFMFEQNWRS